MRRGGITLPEALEREHALRNALNVLELSLALARSAMAEGDNARGSDFIAHAEQACVQCRRLFDAPPAIAPAPAKDD
jgi:hypothetical protein